MLESVLRKNEVPIIVRIQCEKILLDVRCLAPEDMAIIETACTRIAKGVLS